MASFLNLLFDRPSPFRWYLGTRPRTQIVLYCDAQYSLFGRIGVGFVIGTPNDHNSYMGGDVIPHDLLLWMASFGFDKQPLINQCELLAILTAILSAPAIIRDRDIIVWSDNVGALSACVNGYSRNLKWLLPLMPFTCSLQTLAVEHTFTRSRQGTLCRHPESSTLHCPKQHNGARPDSSFRL